MPEVPAPTLRDLVLRAEGFEMFDESRLSEIIAIIEEFKQDGLLLWACFVKVDEEGSPNGYLGRPVFFERGSNAAFVNFILEHGLSAEDRFPRTPRFEKERIMVYNTFPLGVYVAFRMPFHQELIYYKPENRMLPFGLYLDTTYYKVAEMEGKKAFFFARYFDGSCKDSDPFLDSPHFLEVGIWKQL